MSVIIVILVVMYKKLEYMRVKPPFLFGTPDAGPF